MTPYVPARPPDENQAEALLRMSGRRAFALLMAMRMRKTKVVIDDFGRLELEGQARSLLVLAPAGVYRTWAEALDADLSEDLRARLLVWVWRQGRPAGLRAFMAATGRPRALIMNIEAVSRPGPGREALEAFLTGGRPTYVAIDESTSIKNGSKRTKFVLDVVRPLADYRRILSGLATPRSPLDLFYQFAFLDPAVLGHESWYTFRASIAHMRQQLLGGRLVMTIDQNKGENGFRAGTSAMLRDKISRHSFRVEFNPKVPSTFSLREVEMTADQKRHYEELRNFATTRLGADSHVTATVVIAQILRMQQVLLGHVRDDDGVEHIIPESRTAELLAVLDDYDGKAVIWASYDHDVKKIHAALAREYGQGCVARFWGGNERTREDEEKLFKTDPACRFMIATPDSGGKGRTWDVADLAIYYSNRDNLEHRDQSEQRTMGRDKTRGVEIVDLVCRGTVDEKIIQALRKKINMASVINGDNYRSWLI